MMQEKKRNPSPPRDPRLPPKPQGQTVGSFRDGLQTLPKAIAARLGDRTRSALCLQATAYLLHEHAHMHMPAAARGAWVRRGLHAGDICTDRQGLAGVSRTRWDVCRVGSTLPDSLY